MVKEAPEGCMTQETFPRNPGPAADGRKLALGDKEQISLTTWGLRITSFLTTDQRPTTTDN